MKKYVLIPLAAVMLLIFAASVPGKEIEADTTKVAPQDSVSIEAQKAVVYNVYYFHGTQRCATCMKLEAYSREALNAGFEQEQADSTIVFSLVNYDQDENKHYIDDYGLYTKALLISKVQDGKEVAWKNLDKIWQLVNDKEKYLAYVQYEIRKFIDGAGE